MYIGSFLSMDLISNLAPYYVLNVPRGVQLLERDRHGIYYRAHDGASQIYDTRILHTDAEKTKTNSPTAR